MKLGIIDQIPVATDQTATEALERTVNIAKDAEKIGYHRYWLAEHHNSDRLASSAPEIVMAHIAAATEKIRVGSGGIMVMHYSALKVAEVFNTLAALTSNRIDLGMGRAPGGDGATITAMAQGQHFQHDDQYNKIADILNLMEGSPAALREYQGVSVTPNKIELPEAWLLGSTGNSALKAGELGVGYAFAQFFNGEASREIFDMYRKQFIPTDFMENPTISISYAATVAETKEEAEYRARPIDIFRLGIMTGRRTPIMSAEKAKDVKLSEQEEMYIQHNRRIHLVGTPDQVADKVMQDKEAFGFDELMINANHAEFEARMDTYRLLAEAVK